MRILLIGLAGLLAAPGIAHAVDCTAVPQALAVRPTLLAPIASELVPPSSSLGAQSSVLSLAYDEAQAVDQVLLRMRIESCHAFAKAMPAPSAIDPNDPSVYKPKTEFDNTPWRFDMSQNGKRMTADEFSAWMKARGVRVARGAGAAAVPAVAPATIAPGTTVPAAAPGTLPAAPANNLPPGMLPAPVAVPPVAPAPTAAPAPATGETPKTP